MYMHIGVLPIFTLIAKMYSKRVHSYISPCLIIADYAHVLLRHDGCGDACCNNVCYKSVMLVSGGVCVRLGNEDDTDFL